MVDRNEWLNTMRQSNGIIDVSNTTAVDTKMIKFTITSAGTIAELTIGGSTVSTNPGSLVGPTLPVGFVLPGIVTHIKMGTAKGFGVIPFDGQV